MRGGMRTCRSSMTAGSIPGFPWAWAWASAGGCDAAVNRGLAWVAIVGLILLIGSHPGIAAGLFRHFAVILRGAGNELSDFLSQFA